MVAVRQLGNLSTGSTIHSSRIGITSNSVFGATSILQQRMQRNPRSKAGGESKSLIFRLSKLSRMWARTIGIADCNIAAMLEVQLLARFAEKIGIRGTAENPR
jgi:hypothetical protein